MRRGALTVPVLLATCLAGAALAPAALAERPIPRLEHASGRFRLLVDGEPFLILGAQARRAGVRLVVLWFASWKNGEMHYAARSPP